MAPTARKGILEEVSEGMAQESKKDASVVQLPETFTQGGTQAERREILAEASRRYLEFRAALPVPGWWRRDRSVGDPPYGALFSRGNMGLYVLENILTGPKLGMWLHVRVSRKSRRPDWDDLEMVIQDFVTRERSCYQTFPEGTPRNTLHLWTNLDAPGHVLLPDFRETE